MDTIKENLDIEQKLNIDWDFFHKLDVELSMIANCSLTDAPLRGLLDKYGLKIVKK